MGFWSELCDPDAASMQDYGQPQSLHLPHPSLAQAWAPYAAKGYKLQWSSPLAATGLKAGFFFDTEVELSVWDDGSVEVRQGGLHGVPYVVPARPGAPTAQQHLAAIGQG